MNIFILFAIAMIGVAALLILIIRTAEKKMRITSRIAGYIAITVIPTLLLFITAMILMPLGFMMALGFENPLSIIPMWIIVLAVSAISVLIFISINIFNGAGPANDVTYDKKTRELSFGRRLLKYAIYAYILYFTPVFMAFVYLVITEPKKVLWVIFVPFAIIPIIAEGIQALIQSNYAEFQSYVFFGGVTSVITGFIAAFYFIIGTFLVVLNIFVDILIVNGIIRVFYGSEVIRKKGLLYVFMLLFPVLNIVAMLMICRQAKNQLT